MELSHHGSMMSSSRGYSYTNFKVSEIWYGKHLYDWNDLETQSQTRTISFEEIVGK